MPESLTDPRLLNAGTAFSVSTARSPRAKTAVPEVIGAAVRVTIESSDRTDEESDESAGHFLTSKSALSFYSSATFHLIAWGLAFLLCQLLGLDWHELINSGETSIHASLGDEDIAGDAAKFELAGDLGEELEIPGNHPDQISLLLSKSDQAWLNSSTGDVWSNLPAGEAEGEAGGGTGVLLKVPASGLAVTKGSFTAFTIPAQPKPREAYSIVIEVRLKDDVRKYRVSDLSGEVRGSDTYVQKLPFDSRTPLASGYPAEDKKIKPLTMSTVLDVVNNRVQIIVKVPGADRLVRDEIHIRSKKLREEQRITLVFGKAAEEKAEDDKPEDQETE